MKHEAFEIVIMTVSVIGVIAAIILVALLISNYREEKEQREFEKSVKMRKSVEDRVAEIRKTVDTANIKNETTPEIEELDKMLKECSYLVRDGRRDTARLESVVEKLDDLEEKALISIGSL